MLKKLLLELGAWMLLVMVWAAVGEKVRGWLGRKGEKRCR